MPPISSVFYTYQFTRVLDQHFVPPEFGNKATISSFLHKIFQKVQKVQKHGKGDFDQRLVCAVPKHWPKYTTHGVEKCKEKPRQTCLHLASRVAHSLLVRHLSPSAIGLVRHFRPSSDRMCSSSHSQVA